MTTIRKIHNPFINYLMKLPTVANTLFQSQTSATLKSVNKLNSLTYLAFQNRKQKGLISPDAAECPTIYFGDEWPL